MVLPLHKAENKWEQKETKTHNSFIFESYWRASNWDPSGVKPAMTAKTQIYVKFKTRTHQKGNSSRKISKSSNFTVKGEIFILKKKKKNNHLHIL